MARRQTGNGQEIFRVVITRQYANGTHNETFGPYATASAAKAILTSATSAYWGRNTTGHIERATTEWKKVLAPWS